MALTIKNEETCNLARELAELTGETMTVALRDRLERERRERSVEARKQKLMALGRRAARNLGPGPSAIEHGDLLYDERGLPK